ncbi:MAG: lysostaphin resistance A-like protein [Candidatus Odinarchaeota archaeon]
MKRSNSKVQVFRKFKEISLYRIITILIIVFIIIFILEISLIAFSYFESYFYIILCAPAEELFFRGFFLSKLKKIYNYKTYNIKLFKNKKVSLLSIFSVLISSLLFTSFHINYYNNIKMILLLFFGGIIFGSMYWSTDDLTACVLAHLIYNIIAGLKIF